MQQPTRPIRMALRCMRRHARPARATVPARRQRGKRHAAARLGWAFVYASHLNASATDLERTFDTYRDASGGRTPLLAVSAIVAGTRDAAARLASGHQGFRVQVGDTPAVNVGSLEQAHAYIRQAGGGRTGSTRAKRGSCTARATTCCTSSTHCIAATGLPNSSSTRRSPTPPRELRRCACWPARMPTMTTRRRARATKQTRTREMPAHARSHANRTSRAPRHDRYDSHRQRGRRAGRLRVAAGRLRAARGAGRALHDHALADRTRRASRRARSDVRARTRGT